MMDFISNKYSEEEIREYISKNDIIGYEWPIISIYQVLSEEFMREFQNEVNWFGISTYQELSEEFIKEFSEELYWAGISHKQVMSRQFKYSFHDKVFIYKISTSENPKEVL